MVGDRADHVQRDDRDADRAQLLGRDADVAAHDRAGEDEQPGARQVGDGPDGGRDVLLADERDGVDADPLAAQVVAVGLADRAERDLGDLRAAADDDDPLAEDACRAPRVRWTARTSSSASSAATSAVLGDALDLELDLGQGRVALDAGGPWRASGSGRRSAATRAVTARSSGLAIDDIEADRGGRRPAVLVARGISRASRARRRRVEGR